MKILLSAYACEPCKGSEPGTGWNLCTSLARYCDVTVVTRSNNQHAIEQELCSIPYLQTNLSFWYHDLPAPLQMLKRANIIPLQLYYYLWQKTLFFSLQGRITPERFDIIHHLTFNTFEVTSSLVKCGVPFVWGPVGGGQTVPLNLMRWFSLSAAKEMLRNVRVYLTRLFPSVRHLRKRAAFMIYSNQETFAAIPPQKPSNALMLMDVGVAPQTITTRSTIQNPPTGLILGRLEPRKGIHLALAAARCCQMRKIEVRFVFIGDGPLRSDILKFRRRHKLEKFISLKPAVDHAQVLNILGEVDFLLFPSLRDTSGTVVLEAMMAGLPVIALDHQGASLMLDHSCGILVNPQPGANLDQRLAEAIEQLISDCNLMARLSFNAHTRAMKRFTWDVKARSLFNIYLQVIKKKNADKRTRHAAGR